MSVKNATMHENAQLRRTLQKLVRIMNASQRSFSAAKFKVFKLSRSRERAHFKLLTSEPESMMILRFNGFSDEEVAGVLNTKLFKI